MRYKEYLKKENIKDIGDNEKEYFYFFKKLDNFKERDIIYNLIDKIEIYFKIEILKFSLEYKRDGSYFLIEKYK